MTPRRVAFLGPRGTFTEQALRSLPEVAEAELVPCGGSLEVLAAVREGRVDAGCVPIENSVEGAVPAVLDGLLPDPPLVIVGGGRRGRPVRGAGPPRDRAWPTCAASPRTRTASRRPGSGSPTHLPAADVRQSTSTAEAAAQVARGEVDAAVVRTDRRGRARAR